jgi:fatty-acyl-CoA synthase
MGLFVAMEELCQGGCVVTLTNHNFCATELLDAIDREGVSILAIVGDPFGKLISEALDHSRGRWSLSTLKLLISSGAMLSAKVKRDLLARIPRMKVVDSLCSTEVLFMGSWVSSLDTEARTGRFRPERNTRVIGFDDQDIRPGSGAIGLLAVGGFHSMGFYKDPVMSNAYFRVIGSKCYAVPGDYAFVNEDGTFTFAGRGSGCINSAGEQIFPEEVEAVLKLYPAICDAAVVGVPHDYYGEMVVAVIQLQESVIALIQPILDHVKKHVASYKAPRALFTVESIDRYPNGKIDYPRMREMAINMIREQSQEAYTVGPTRIEKVEPAT